MRNTNNNNNKLDQKKPDEIHSEAGRIEELLKVQDQKGDLVGFSIDILLNPSETKGKRKYYNRKRSQRVR